MSIDLGQPVVIENRPGATGKIGSELVARSEANGYVLLYNVVGDLSILQGKADTPEVLRRLTPVSSAVTTVSILAARPNLPQDSVVALLDYVRRNPGKISYGSTGVGSFQHLLGERLKQLGYDMLHVPYKGVAASLPALIAGDIDVGILNLSQGLPVAKQGRIRILAVAMPQRFRGAPDIPSINEALPEFNMPIGIYAYYGPPGLPKAIGERLALAVARTLDDAEIRKRVTEMFMEPVPATPDQFADVVRETAAIYQKIIQSANIKLD